MTNANKEVVKEKRLIINRKVLFTIPNILTYIRILCVPIYMTLVILGAKAQYPDWYVFLGLGIMIFAALTDLIDGKIARKYPGQGTYLGQLIDPVADKLMHVGALLALVIAGYLSWIFLVLIVVREFLMFLSGTIIFNDVNVQANMLGKVASATLSFGIILSFFHMYFRTLWGEFGIDWIVVSIAVVLSWIAMINYARVQIPAFFAIRKARKEASKIDDTKIDETKEN